MGAADLSAPCDGVEEAGGMSAGALLRQPGVGILAPPRLPPTVRQLRHIGPTIALLWLPVILAVAGHLPGSGDLARGFPMLRALLIGGLAPLLIAAGAARLRERSWEAAGRALWAEGWLTERVVRHVLIGVSFAAFFWAFSSWKSIIPSVHPYGDWDERLRAVGAWLHGGQPDVTLAPWFGTSAVLIGLDRLYESWWFVLVGVVLYEIWQPDLAKAKRFLLAFVLTWIVLGTFVATAFSSVGPCFAGLITGTHIYDPLLARLRAADAVAPMTALRAQAYLWEAYTKGIVPPGGGISAFPSLHVAGATLCALALGQRSRWLGAAGWMYVGLTWIASIMLGWHYALDGEVGMLGVGLCWALAGVLTSPIPVDAYAGRWTWRASVAALEPAVAPQDSVSPGRRTTWTFYS
jgi:hypothetical protein